MFKVYFFVPIFLFLSNQALAQENESQDVPGTAFFIELGGKWFCSANIDFRINKSNRYGLGVSPVCGDVVPTVMYYHLGGKKSRFELGCGLGYVIILDKDIEREDFKGLTFHGVIGYRSQKKNGLLFRIGFTPIIYSDVFLPFVGLSFGYSL